MIEAVEGPTDRAAYDGDGPFEMVLREQADRPGPCIINPSIGDAATSPVQVQGEFTSVADLDYEQGYPVPSVILDDRTVFPLRLGPDEAALVGLLPWRAAGPAELASSRAGTARSPGPVGEAVV